LNEWPGFFRQTFAVIDDYFTSCLAWFIVTFLIDPCEHLTGRQVANKTSFQAFTVGGVKTADLLIYFLSLQGQFDDTLVSSDQLAFVVSRFLNINRKYSLTSKSNDMMANGDKCAFSIKQHRNKFVLVQALLFLNAALRQHTTLASAKTAAATSLHPSSSGTAHSKRKVGADLTALHSNDKSMRQSTKVLERNEQDTSLQQYYDDSSRYSSTDGTEDEEEKNDTADYSDILVVVAVDGTMAGISRSTGKTVWRTSLKENVHEFQDRQTAAAEASLLAPLISTTTKSTAKEDEFVWKTSAVPSIDGKVHLTAPLRDGMLNRQATDEVTVTTTMSELVSRVPFVDNRGRIYTGSRHSMAVSIDSRTGKILQHISGETCSNPSHDETYVVWLGRVDQTVSIQEPRRGIMDVQFTQGRILSINDMVLGSGQPWEPPEPGAYSDSRLPLARDGNKGSLFATPSGVLAFRQENNILWMAEDFFESPVAFAVDVASGSSLPVTIIPDPAIPNNSPEYLLREIQRQLQASATDDEQTIIAALPSGQLYAMPLKYHSPMHDESKENIIDGPDRPEITSNGEVHVDEVGSCHPGNAKFPACLYDAGQNPFAPMLVGEYTEDTAIVPLFHPDYGYIPSYYHIPITEKRKQHKILRILGSWLPPTVALIFVVSFEMGRRKRLKDLAESGDVSSSTLPTEEGGVIQVYDDVILGYGGHGTVVFKGLLDGRQVAVKRMLKAYHASADREISLLIESDGHANVVRYFLKETRGDFVYLALELCDLSLHDLIGALCSEPQVRSLAATRSLLVQIANGVRHLHRLRIVHRDLKPANILLADMRNQKSKRKDVKKDDESPIRLFERGLYVAKISDMGLGKQLVGQSSYGASLLNESSLRGVSNGEKASFAEAGPGSVGWQAPEVMARRIPSDGSVRSEGSMNPESASGSSPADNCLSGRTSRSVDIFSLGCIFYSTLKPGSHPFGEWYEREANIMHNRPQLDALKNISLDAYDLVASMLQRNPLLRPTASQVCEHPFFWSAERRLAFLCEFSDRLEMDYDVTSQTMTRLLAVEQGAAQVVGTSWDNGLEPELLSNVQRFRTYDPSSVRDLLRLMRNKHHHFDEMSDNLKITLKSKTDGLLEYFEQRFPRLLIHCYNFCREYLSVDDPLSVKYNIAHYGQKKRLGDKALAEVVEVDERGEGTPTKDRHATVFSRQNVPEMIPESPLESDPQRFADAAGTILRSASNSEDVSSLPLDVNTVGDVIIWHGSTAARSLHCRGWSRSDEEWIRRVDASLRKRDTNLERCAEDPKFRTRLCNHWDVSYGTSCPMRKKNKCVFAHGPVELRVKDTKRNRWGKLVDANGDCKNPQHSGGEDTYGAARSIETNRKQDGKWNLDLNGSSGGRGKQKSGATKKKVESKQKE
jgi:serine/threonine-protein kinase/endoribonuclease IRE1